MTVVAAEDAELAALRAGCARFLNGHGRPSAADMLATIPADTEVDRYGDGGAVAAIEAEIAALLRKQAAIFLPSGTMTSLNSGLPSRETCTQGPVSV